MGYNPVINCTDTRSAKVVSPFSKIRATVGPTTARSLYAAGPGHTTVSGPHDAPLSLDDRTVMLARAVVDAGPLNNIDTPPEPGTPTTESTIPVQCGVTGDVRDSSTR